MILRAAMQILAMGEHCPCGDPYHFVVATWRVYRYDPRSNELRTLCVVVSARSARRHGTAAGTVWRRGPGHARGPGPRVRPQPFGLDRGPEPPPRGRVHQRVHHELFTAAPRHSRARLPAGRTGEADPDA